jgi:bis(5'-nucleosyl)-tetraphosphatase (symmetrical)
VANYVIGDIQGCFDEYSLLLNKIKFDSKKDFIWLTGDLINRGPASLSVLKHVYDNRKAIKTVLGNHDLHFLAVYYGVRKLNKFDTLSDLLNFQDVDELAKWLTKQPLVREIKIGKREFIMVHAGFPKSATKRSLTEVNGKIKKALKNNPKKTLKMIFDHKRIINELNLIESANKELTQRLFC